MTSYKVETVPSPISVLGEGPHWDVERQSLYYNDIYGDKFSILRYDYNENKTYYAVVPGEPVVSFIIPVEGSKDEFIIGTGKRVTLIKWDGKCDKATVLGIVGKVEDDLPKNRFNDAKVDPQGRFFGGTMRIELDTDIFDHRLGSLYTYSKQSGFTVLKEKIGCSNGLCWNEKTNKFYYIDSVDLDVKEFDWDPKTGKISNGKSIIDFSDNGQRPNFVADGMTIDSDGNLYVATFGASKIFKVNPSTGKIDLEIKIPAEQVTSVAFGGPNLDILYVTTASKEFKSPQPPPAGSLFKVTGLGAKGLKMHSVKLN